MQGILEDDDHVVRCAKHGKQAIKLIEEELPDLIVTDLRMPEMNGLELIEFVVSQFPSIPSVVVTAHGSEDLAVDALALGAANFVPKNSLNILLSPVVRQSLIFLKANEFAQSMGGQFHSPEFYFKLNNSLDSITPATSLAIQAIAASGKMTPNNRVRVAVAVASALFNSVCFGNLELIEEDETLGRAISGERESWQAIAEKARLAPYRKRAVHLKVSVGEDDTRISVEHDGPGRIARFSPAPGTPESFEREQCRGMMLMTSFIDDVMFDSDFSKVVMVKKH